MVTESAATDNTHQQLVPETRQIIDLETGHIELWIIIIIAVIVMYLLVTWLSNRLVAN